MFRGSRGSSNYNRSSRGGKYNTTPSSRNGTATLSTKQRGLFADGIWHCDCSPRQPAEHFRVKKDGKNHGRWFYTCQNAENKRCGFFLWEDDAKPREEGAVLNNSRTEPGREDETAGRDNREDGQRYQQDMAQANPAWAAANQQKQQDQGKRMFDEVDLIGSDTEDEDDELLSWPATAATLITPHKAQKTDAYATPATTVPKRRLPWLEYPGEEDVVTTPETPSKPGKASNESSATASLPTPTQTKPIIRYAAEASALSPVPQGRFKDALLDQGPILSATDTLTDQVIRLLSENNVKLDTGIDTLLKALLGKHEMKLQGVIKGRDLVRTALKTRDARVVELQAKIAGLEAEKEAWRTSLKARNHGYDE